jgi:ankyrin repeat protein
LLRNGADVELAADNDATPLFIAAANGNSCCVSLLLDAGANAKKEAGGYTPACIAEAMSHREVLEVLANKAVIVPETGGTNEASTPWSRAFEAVPHE